MNRKQRIYKKNEKRTLKESRRDTRDLKSRSTEKLKDIRIRMNVREFRLKVQNALSKVDFSGLHEALSNYSKELDVFMENHKDDPVNFDI